MRRIEEFEYTEHIIAPSVDTKLYRGVISIPKEVKRPIISFFNTNNKSIDLSSHELQYYAKDLKTPYFSTEDLNFLSKTYKFEIEKFKNYKNREVMMASNKHHHSLFKSSGVIILIEDQDLEYLIIEFNRWQHEYQPRSAGEDQLGEDITYIHGIWETPLLTDSIIDKIKAKQ